MFHIGKLGKAGCRLLVEDFIHFVKTNSLKGTRVKQNTKMYGEGAIKRWSTYTSLTPARAREVAQKFDNLHKYKRINTPNTKNPGRNGITKMTILLCIKDDNFVIRDRDTWTKQMQKGNAGMLVRGKKEYEWEELPPGHTSQRYNTALRVP